MSVLGKSAAIFGGYEGMKGGVKLVAAIAAGRWIYNKFQENRNASSSASDQ